MKAQEAIRNIDLPFGGSRLNKENSDNDECIKKLQSKVGELTMFLRFLRYIDY